MENIIEEKRGYNLGFHDGLCKCKEDLRPYASKVFINGYAEGRIKGVEKRTKFY